MKRLHIHVGVENLDESVKFYNALFGAEPSKVKPDYAKWMLEDPHVNFAISTRAGKSGVDHLGIQVDSAEELDALRGQIADAEIAALDEGETTCCYAKSDKSWVTDPAGIAWEAYHTMEDAQMFSGKMQEEKSACCVPESKPEKTACCAPAEKTSGCCG
jgi:catechol 2,3-dioxygenase-like lactoylglutathione lyase family enzyme